MLEDKDEMMRKVANKEDTLGNVCKKNDIHESTLKRHMWRNGYFFVKGTRKNIDWSQFQNEENWHERAAFQRSSLGR